jgi:CRP-like cAMP-binding protein/tetratricopeptide (TPR) repeat protein
VLVAQAAELERARKAVLSGQPAQGLAPEHEIYGSSKRRRSVVAADILQLGRGSLSASKGDLLEAAAARRGVLGKSSSVPALHSSSPWRPAGAEHKEPSGVPKLHNAHATTKSVAIMKRHMEAVRVHFIARAAALRERDRREEEAKVRKVETVERKTKILGEIKTSLHRAATGVPFTDAHADRWDITQAHHTWAPFDILHGDPKEPPDSALDNLTKAHHYVRRGLGKREAGEDEAAIAMFSRALKMDTRSTNALLLRGAAHFRMWKVESALADFNRCLLIQPRNEMALYNRALSYYALGNWHACIEDLNTCIELNATDNDALQLRGLVHRRMRQYDAAHHDYSSLMYVNMAAARTAAAQKASVEVKPLLSNSVPRHLASSSSLPSLAKPLGGAAATHSIASLSFGPEQTNEQLRDILTGGNDLFGLVFEKPTVIQHALQTPPSRKTEEDISSIKTMMAGLIFFRGLTPVQQAAFAKACFSKTFMEGDVITTEAEPVRYMYVILSGECTVKVSVDGSKPRDGRSTDAAPSTSTEISVDTYVCFHTSYLRILSDMLTLCRYKTGDHFGHLSLLFGEQRTLTVLVKSPQVELVLLPRTAFFRIGLDDAFIDDLEHRRDLLQRTGAFVGWSEADLLKLCCTAKYRQCRKHTLLIKQGNMPKEFMVLTKGIVNVYKASDALADVDLRIKTLNEEISNVKQLFSYHYSMRTRKGPVIYEEDEEATTPEPELKEDTSADRATLLSKILGQGHSQVTSLSAALKTFKAKGGVIDEEAQAAAEAGAVINENLRLPATTKYRPPRVQSLPDTFVEEYVKELQAKLAAISKQRQQVLRQHGRAGDAVAADGASASRQYRVLVESLYPPCILSPLAITDPWHGFEPGEFVAETYVELLVISKTQIDHRMFTKAQIADITSRASRFPRDGVVIDRFKKDAEWKRYRERAVDMIDKRRWPLDMHDSRLEIRSNGRHIVVPIENHASKTK